MHVQTQTSTKPIIAVSASDSAIIAAANERAAFWQYPLTSTWAVTVGLPDGKHEVTVYHGADGQYTIKRGFTK